MTKHRIRELQAQKTLQRYKEAFKGARGRVPKVSYERGWYFVEGKCLSLPAVIKQTLFLEASAHAQELGGENV